VNMIFSLDINEHSGPFKKFNIFPYREMMLNLQSKTDFHEFYNVKGTIMLNEVTFASNDTFYGVASQLMRSQSIATETNEAIKIAKSESRFAMLDNGNLFAEGQFEMVARDKRLPFKYEVLLQDRKFESGKITGFSSGQRGAVYLLQGSLQEPLLQ
ncbi:MAG: hypothetical protein AABZ31_00130, partial [Bdellovibrionota bacterium]